MRAREFITGHVIYNPAYTYKFQLKTHIEYGQSRDNLLLSIFNQITRHTYMQLYGHALVYIVGTY